MNDNARAYLGRFIRDQKIPIEPDDLTGENGTQVLPLRIRGILYGLEFIENQGNISIRIPLFDLPVEKQVLPLYRRLLELNHNMPDARFSLSETTVFLTTNEQFAVTKLPVGYRRFASGVKRLLAILDLEAAELISEFTPA